MTIDPSDFKSVAITGIGAVIGYVSRMFTTEGKIKNDLSYIRGQLSNIVRLVEEMDKLKLSHVRMEGMQEKARRDIDAAHEKLRSFERPITKNGGKPL